MHQLKQYWVAEALEKDLGDPLNPDSVMSFKSALDLDEREEFGHQEIEWLYNWNLHHHYIPAECGGEFTSLDEFVAFVRVMSRRDLSTAISFTTMFWSFLTWMAGTEEQKQRLVRFMKDNHGAMCLSYSERAHGSDLVASDVRATKVPGGYLLNGEKWLDQPRYHLWSYLCPGEDRRLSWSDRSLSLFMVDKSRLDPATYYNLPKIKTHGIRGCDMSGIGFKDCFIPEDMRLGAEGAGLELALKGFQITRMLCSAFSLGAADTALRTVVKFALERKLYGRTVFSMPHPRSVLVDAFLDQLTAECVTIAGARGFHVAPEQCSVWSAVVKYFVPVTCERLVQDVSVVLGARYYMREEHDFGIFQKMVRDNAIISVFDGSTVVNLHALLLQLRQLAKYRARKHDPNDAALQARLETVFSLEKPLPTFQPKKLELFSRGCDDVLQGLEMSLIKLYSLKASSIDAQVLQQLIELTSVVLEELNEQDQLLVNSAFEYGHDQSPELFELAKRYCTLHAAATCLHMWLYNRTILGEFFANGEWLVLCLNRLVQNIRPSQGIPRRLNDEKIALELVRLYSEDQLFSIVPIQLAHTETQEDHTDATSELQLQA